MQALLLSLFSLGASAFLTHRFCRPASRFHILDVPNERSLHAQPTPRTGGIAIVVASLLSAAAYAWQSAAIWPVWALGVAVVIMGFISYADDRYGVGVTWRLLVHTIAAVWYVWGLAAFLSLATGWLELAFAAMFLVWTINLYNFMDGMDGFAGGMGIFGFGTLATLGWAADNPSFVALNIMVAAATAGFLIFNFPPARIFMGDVGSTVLGFLAGAFALWGVWGGIMSLPVALLAFSVFVVDATVTLARRALRGENVLKAHRSHFYQRAVQLGFSHRQVVLVEYGLMLATALTAIGIRQGPLTAQWSAVAVWGVIYGLAMVSITRVEQAKRRI